jgi:hypothetical protein
VNTGINSTCKACAQSNRECTYPVAGSVSTPKRSEPTPGIKQEHDGESKKRIRKVEDSGRRNSTRAGDDPLDSPILTKKVWSELYDLFKLHFSTEMPFLHPPTFRNRMRLAAFPRDPSTSAAELGDGKVLLLGVLTLTARFHPELVAHHSPLSNTNDQLAASEYYATALAAAFGPTSRNITKPSLEGIQALLMLGLYEWGQTRGLSAWVYVGIAIRLAQSMGLEYEDDPDIHSHKSSSQKAISMDLPVSQIATEREVRRRTLWSCFIMDRALSAGKFRPTMMNPDKFRVRLPCSESHFLFADSVQTGFLNSNWLGEPPSRSENSTVNDDGVLSRYVRLVEIFGRFSEWSYAGGRRTEKLTPWDKSSEVYKLRRQLEGFHDALPSNLTFTEANLSAHIEQRNATPYASMHTLYSLCLIMLHREYIPFIPLRCEGPQGPLDEPTFPKEKYNVPEGFWDESAEIIFKAARDILDIVSTCQDSNALPESPQIGFAVYQAAFVAVYAGYFPHMDVGCHVHSSDTGQSNGDFRDRGYMASAAKILSDLVPKLRMAKGYLTYISRMHTYFHGVIHDYTHQFGKKHLSFSGGGLEQYKKFEKELKEFGSLSDTDRNIPSDGSDVADQTRSRASTNDIQGSSVNGEPMQGVEAPAVVRPNGSWAPINATSPPAESEERPAYSQSRHPYGMPYQQSPNQSSNAPSLISPSNGDTTPSVNSPYSSAQATQYHSSAQPQHAASYSSIAQHTMAPPNPQVPPQVFASDQKFESFINFQENISMNGTGFDNYAQQYPMDMWGNGYPLDVQPGAPVPYTQALNGPVRNW